ncbi:hypothetical protein [Coleofasciculus sp. G2-EDA-02]
MHATSLQQERKVLIDVSTAIPGNGNRFFTPTFEFGFKKGIGTVLNTA